MKFQKHTLLLGVRAALANSGIAICARLKVPIFRILVILVIVKPFLDRGTVESAQTPITCRHRSWFPLTFFPSHLFEGVGVRCADPLTMYEQ